jgi:NAD(P)-dependent dehydrogenase (short-subunit alcohol dehydrogenase family)
LKDKFSLLGKTVLITGAAGLLGKEHARAVLSAGGGVILTDIGQSALSTSSEELASEFGGDLIFSYSMDVTEPNSIRAVFDALVEIGIRVDVLINNAAIDPKVDGERGIVETSRLENFTLEQWNLELAVGLTGAFLCSQVFGAQMAVDGQGGVILNIASDLSVFSPDQRLYQQSGLPANQQPVKPATYSVIKTGLIGLTRYLSTYWADRGVRSNALSPGGIYTGQGDEFVQKLERLIPMGRMAKADEYQSAIQFLCSDASAYMNGQNIVMDGGRSSW